MSDSPSFEQLVDMHYQPLYRFALSLSRDADTACDLTQETFAIWAAKGHQLRDLSKAKTWLFTTMHREFLRLKRREKHYEPQELGELEHELPALSPSIVNQMDAGTVMEMLGRVDEPYRIPLSLFYFEDFSYMQIAETLEIPIGTVMSRLARGKRALRELLQDSGEAAS